MTAEAVYKNKILYLRMSSNDGILIQCVVLIVACPGSLDLVKRKIKALELTLLHLALQKYSLTDFENQKINDVKTFCQNRNLSFKTPTFSEILSKLKHSCLRHVKL